MLLIKYFLNFFYISSVNTLAKLLGHVINVCLTS